MDAVATPASDGPSRAVVAGQLRRAIDWKGAFWLASGVPPLVLFSIGGIGAAGGKAAFVIWAVSMAMGFVQSFTYAEISGLFPSKSGGASIYGAAAWVRYSKLVAPLSVWCNWIAWTPVLSLGCSLAAGYLLTLLLPPGSPVATAVLAEATIPGIAVKMTFGATFFIGAALMLLVFAVQHRGILGAARVQRRVAVAVLAPLLIVGVVPLFRGGVAVDNLTPLLPPVSYGDAASGAWDRAGWGLVLGGMFIAAWSTYGFETAVCYTSELKDPGTDTFKAIFYSGLLCAVFFLLVPLSFQGALGVNGMLAPDVVSGSGVARAMASLVGGGVVVQKVLGALLVLALLLAIMTAMAGSSRTLYQGSVDGWLPRYLAHVNHRGAPTRAMWTDLGANLFLLSLTTTDYFFVLGVSNCGYIIFNFLNLNAGWIHRIDNRDVRRPWRAPSWLIGTGAVLAFVNAFFMGAGASVWGKHVLLAGVAAAALIVPVFCVRHYLQDGGKFPRHMLADLDGGAGRAEKKAGMLPYLALIAGVATVCTAAFIF